ncbi:MAG: type III PLP-dependent enzyme [Hydrotalea sp.]|nr:type III PLP-dependent enzyme [Hydrotalea sp.]
MLSEKQKKFLLGNEKLPTPFQVIDLELVAEQYKKFRDHLSFANIYYAVKSNPNDEVVKKLVSLGSYFDTASIEEIDQVLSHGATPDKLSYGSTIKKSSAIKAALAKGIRLFAMDSDMELKKIADEAKALGLTDVGVYCRILHDGTGSGYPLNHKFGTTPAETIELLSRARELGLVPRGVSFHVGSQARLSAPWLNALKTVKEIFDALAARGIMLDLINLGGGYPARYRNDENTMSIDAIGADIAAEIKKLFGDQKIYYLIEPGRALVAEAAISVAEVILKSHKENSGEWLYIDLGVYNGLFEAIDPTAQHVIAPLQPIPGPTEPMILAGPTCDSWDTLYSKAKYDLPRDLKPGDRLVFINTGSYSGSMSSLNFNGFAPIHIYTI